MVLFSMVTKRPFDADWSAHLSSVSSYQRTNRSQPPALVERARSTFWVLPV